MTLILPNISGPLESVRQILTSFSIHPCSHWLSPVLCISLVCNCSRNKEQSAFYLYQHVREGHIYVSNQHLTSNFKDSCTVSTSNDNKLLLYVDMNIYRRRNRNRYAHVKGIKDVYYMYSEYNSKHKTLTYTLPSTKSTLGFNP